MATDEGGGKIIIKLKTFIDITNQGIKWAYIWTSHKIVWVLKRLVLSFSEFKPKYKYKLLVDFHFHYHFLGELAETGGPGLELDTPTISLSNCLTRAARQTGSLSQQDWG